LGSKSDQRESLTKLPEDGQIVRRKNNKTGQHGLVIRKKKEGAQGQRSAQRQQTGNRKWDMLAKGGFRKKCRLT